MRLHASRTWDLRRARPEPCQKADFFKPANHIKGVFAADIMAIVEISRAQGAEVVENRFQDAAMRWLVDVFANARAISGTGSQ